MDSVKIRELEEKTTVNPTDVIVIEDYDGTKVVSVLNLQSAIQKALYFNTIDDMKAATLNEGDVVKTLGYHSINDGGAATYVIQYAPVEVDNGITIIYLDTSDTLRAHLVHNGSINPIQAGAYADGVHNDYPVLNKLLKMNMEIDFPPKSFNIGENIYLNINSDSKIDFGGATIVGTGGIELGLNSACDNVYLSNLIIENGSIRLDKKASYINIQNCKFYSANGIEIHGATGVYISDCVFGASDHRITNGIYMDGGTDITIDSCTFLMSKTGININTYPCQSTTVDNWAKHIDITRCTFNGNEKLANGIIMGSVQHLASISSCFFSNLSTAITITSGAKVQLSVSDIGIADSNYGFSSNGGLNVSGSTLSLSGAIEYRMTKASAYSASTNLFNLKGITVINNATYNLSHNTSNGNSYIHSGISHIGNKVYSKDALYHKIDRLSCTVDSAGLLNIYKQYDGKLSQPLFDMDISVSGGIDIQNITTADDSYTNKKDYHGYTGQILSLYATDNTYLNISSSGNIRCSGYPSLRILLTKIKPVKIQYNGAYWDVIDYE